MDASATVHSGFVAQSARPSTYQVLKMLYWTMRKHPETASHILAVILGSLSKLAALQFGRLRRKHLPLVALALVEHMGDIVAAEPVARHARRKFPDAKILWFVRKPYRVLPDAYPEVTKVIVVQCITEWLLVWSYGALDVVWDLHLSERRCPQCNVFFRKPGGAGKITFETYYDLGSLLDVQCMSAGIDKLQDGPVLTSSPDTIRSVDALALPARFIVIHAKSNDSARDWPEAKWMDLTSHLRTLLNCYIIEVGTEPRIIRSDGTNQRSLSGKLSVLETAEVIRRAELFIGIDSGPAHLANAVGTPGVLLLGHYQQFQSYMPYSGAYASGLGATILRANGPVADLPIRDVIEAVTARLPPYGRQPARQ
jgi:heptosyltransferase-3